MEIAGYFFAWAGTCSNWSVWAHIWRSAGAWVTLWPTIVWEQNFQYLYIIIQIIYNFRIFHSALFSSSDRVLGEGWVVWWTHLVSTDGLALKKYAPKHLLKGTFDRFKKDQVWKKLERNFGRSEFKCTKMSWSDCLAALGLGAKMTEPHFLELQSFEISF